MSLDLKRVREDAHEQANKKRMTLASSNGAGVSVKLEPNGTSTHAVEEEEPVEEWMKVVETKRKQAIYRQMLEYRRQAHRHSLRIQALEQERSKCQAEVMSVDVCWTELVAAVQEMANVETDDKECLEPKLEPPPFVPALEDFTKALHKRSQATRSLIEKVLRQPSSSSNPRKPILDAEQHAQATQLLEAQLRDVIQARDQIERDLKKAEKTVDRLRMEGSSEEKKPEGFGGPPSGPSAATAGSGARSGTNTPNARNGSAGPEEIKQEQSPTDMLGDTTELQRLADRRAKEIVQLREEQTKIMQENDQLRLLASQPSDTAILASPFFATYKLQLVEMIKRAETAESNAQQLDNTVKELKQNNLHFRDAVAAEARAEVDALRSQTAKKDLDLSRLRGQRDDFQAELFERRARDAEKWKFADELQVLANARQERIAALSSEVRRLKGKMAAGAGMEDYYAFLVGVGDAETGYVKEMETKMAAARENEVALQAQLAAYAAGSGSSQDVIQSESKARAELQEAKALLKNYERVLGPNASAAEDLQAMAKRLEGLEAERKKLELRVQETDDSTNALYTELEQLSKAWEVLEQQNRSKVFDLKDAELKVSRLTTEKAKSDNKYFAAMRAKDMVDLEAKAHQVKVEKQMRLLEKAGELERTLNAQLAAQTQATVSIKSTASDLQHQLARISSEKKQMEISLVHGQTLLAEAKNSLSVRVAEANAERAARSKLEEELEATKRSVVKLNERQETMATTSLSVGEVKLQEERDKLLKILRCSCCEQNFKQQVITKCMHTFCKDCLDKRVASRQRKCPACGGGFSKEDIGTLYWQ